MSESLGLQYHTIHLLCPYLTYLLCSQWNAGHSKWPLTANLDASNCHFCSTRELCTSCETLPKAGLCRLAPSHMPTDGASGRGSVALVLKEPPPAITPGTFQAIILIFKKRGEGWATTCSFCSKNAASKSFSVIIQFLCVMMKTCCYSGTYLWKHFGMLKQYHIWPLLFIVPVWLQRRLLHPASIPGLLLNVH